MTVIKSDLIDELRGSLNLSKKDASVFLESMLEEIKLQLEGGEAVSLQGFGSFDVRSKNSRIARNPRTGESATVSARKVVTFKPGKLLKAKPIVEDEQEDINS